MSGQIPSGSGEPLKGLPPEQLPPVSGPLTGSPDATAPVLTPSAEGHSGEVLPPPKQKGPSDPGAR